MIDTSALKLGTRYVVSTYSGGEYCAVWREDGFHLTDAVRWEDPTSMPDQILAAREWRGFVPPEEENDD